MNPRHSTIVLALSLANASVIAAQQGSQLVGFGGRSDGLLALGIAPRTSTNFYGAELLTNAPRTFHWTIGLAHSSVTERNACCGPTPTLSYHYHALLPAVGAAYDFVWTPIRVRLGASAGPLGLRQSSSGTPPPGVGTRDPNWQWSALATSFGASLHYEVSEEFGLLAGVRIYNAHSILGPMSEGRATPYLGASWTSRGRPRRTTPSPQLEIDTIAAERGRLIQTLLTLEAGTPVRVASRTALFEGQYTSLSADSLVVSRALGQDTIALADITSAWTPQRRVARSTLIGAAWGAGIAAAIVGIAAAREEQDCSDFCIPPPTLAVIVAIPGAVAGALVGNIVGWANRPWRRIYP
jgi:hypothetical protein